MNKTKKIKCMVGSIFTAVCFFLFTGNVFAATDEEITDVLLENIDIFVTNNIFVSTIRGIGWGLVKVLTWGSTKSANLFDNAFRFIDFTEIDEVQNFITSFQPIFAGLICASLLFLGLTLIFWYEKKPKLVMNICIAVLVVTSSTYLIQKLNTFIASDIRGAIIGQNENAKSEDMVYNLVGASVYDLRYLDNTVDGGLMNLTKDNRTTFSKMTEQDVQLIDINEIVKPDDVQDDSKDLMEKKIDYYSGDTSVTEIYNGVAWTDLLNEYYYRYNVNWFNCIIGLLTFMIVYICLAYKVVRILYEIVIHQLVAYLYAANLTNSQKVFKVLDGIKDSYITLFLVMICVKVYTLAYYFVNGLNVDGFTKAMLLVFVAFAVVDGPNIIQKLTGIDAGLSSGVGKIIAATQMTRTVGHGMNTLAHGIGHTGSAIAEGIRNNSSSNDMNKSAVENFGNSNNNQSDNNGTGSDGSQEGFNGENPDGNQEEFNGENPDGNQEGFNGENLDGNQEEFNGENPDGNQEEFNGTGFNDESNFNPEDGSNNAFSAETEMPEQTNDLNGLDPINGQESRHGKYADLTEMEKELSKTNGNMKSDIGHNEPLDFGGGIFRKDNHFGNHINEDTKSDFQNKNSFKRKNKSKNIMEGGEL